MRVPWKLIGLAGVAGVAASGAVVVRRRRGQEEYDPEALREKLRGRLAATRGQETAPEADGASASPRAGGAQAGSDASGAALDASGAAPDAATGSPPPVG